MVFRLKSTPIEGKMTILIPFMIEDYDSFKMIDVLRLNKMHPFLDNDGIKHDLINPNENYDLKINKKMELLIKVTERFADRQELLKRRLNGNEKLRIRESFAKLVDKLEISDSKIILYYQPYFSKNLYTYLHILKEIKNNFKNMILICAGAYFDTMPHTILKKYAFIDYILSRNCSDFASKIIKKTHNKEIKGITYRINGNIVTNLDVGYDLNKDPMPNHLFISKHPGVVPIEYSAGCTCSCFFCDLREFQQKFQLKNVDLLIKEIELHYARGVSCYWFIGSVINIEEGYVRKLCEEIIKRDLKIKWGAALMPSNIEKTTYELLYKAGCVQLRMGIETVNKDILRSFGKDMTLRSVASALEDSHRANIKNALTFMVGVPNEKEGDVAKKMAFIKKHRNFISSSQFFIFQLRVGAPIYESAYKFGLQRRKNTSDDQRYVKYDEINGLRWEDIYTRQKIMLNQCEAFQRFQDIPSLSPENAFIKLISNI